jgi:hypothetical protein
MAVRKALSADNPVRDLRWATFLDGDPPAQEPAPNKKVIRKTAVAESASND